MGVGIDTKHLSNFVSDAEFDAIYPQVELAHRTLHEKTGPGSDFLGWVDLPVNYDKEEFARIRKAAAKIQSDSDVLVVIGSIARICSALGHGPAMLLHVAGLSWSLAFLGFAAAYWQVLTGARFAPTASPAAQRA